MQGALLSPISAARVQGIHYPWFKVTPYEAAGEGRQKSKLPYYFDWSIPAQSMSCRPLSLQSGLAPLSKRQ